MRISDWSSDVCSSDLHRGAVEPDGVVEAGAHEAVVLDLPVGGGALGVKGHDGVGGQVVGEVGEGAGLEHGIVADRVVTLEPRRAPALLGAAGAHERAVERRVRKACVSTFGFELLPNYSYQKL